MSEKSGLNIPRNAPSGTSVQYIDDGGLIHYTVTRSEPWQLGGGQWVVLLEGRSGGYSLNRVMFR